VTAAAGWRGEAAGPGLSAMELLVAVELLAACPGCDPGSHVVDSSSVRAEAVRGREDRS